MPISQNKQFDLLFFVFASVTSPLLACSSAHLDPNTRAVTFNTPTLKSSAAPTASHPPPTGVRQSVSVNSNAASNGAPETVAPKAPAPQVCSRLPDPKPLETTDWLRLTVRYEKGTLLLVRAEPERTKQPQPTVRKMGRFAAELWIGCELIERVRFDFPLLAAEPAERTQKRSHQPDFEQQGRFETTLLVPNSERATRLELRDRAYEEKSDTLVNLPWPLASETVPPKTPLPSPSNQALDP